MRYVLIFMFIASPAFAQCNDAKDKALCADLVSIEQRDQAARNALITDRQNVALIAEMNKTDREDLARVEAIIAKHGWPGKSLVGSQAAQSAWLVIQHSDVATQKKYMPMMTKAAESGELDRGKVAMTIDHILISEGKPQLFGSAFKEVNGEFVPEPIQDQKNLDARRKEVGLGPFAEYAAALKEMYSQPQQKKPSTIVARVWRGRVPTSRADEYAKYLYDNGPVKIRAVAGNLGAEMLRRTDGDVTEFVVISYWPNRESIKAFAGENIDKARFLPRDREFLINPDEFVRHYDVTSAP
jgi:heme-degrading monooxygenase HmoA